jgi:phage tail-like protein
METTMAGETENAVWPLPKFYFTVTGLSGGPASFQEVTGLESETRPIEYRKGNSPVFTPIKMPGLGKVGNVTLRKGIFTNDSALWGWFNQIAMNTAVRSTIVVNLLDETGAPTMTWTLNNAFPTKITGPDLNSEGNEVAIETLEIAYETLVISAP